jgi:hypothetical protein
MPKSLKFILNFFAVISIFFLVLIWFASGPLYILILPLSFFFKDIESTWYVWLFLLFIILALHRVLITATDLLLVKPYLQGENVDEKIFKINAYVACSLYFSSIFLTLFFLAFLNRLIGLVNFSLYITWGLITLIAGLVAVTEVYIKSDYFIEKHLTINPKKVAQLLSIIIIPMYVLPVAGVGLYVCIKSLL